MDKIIWSNKANDDLIEIYNYISYDSVYYATKTIDEIHKRINYLYQFPYMGKKLEEFNKQYRELIYKSYRIIYRVTSKNIYIVRVWHSARFLNKLFLK